MAKSNINNVRKRLMNGEAVGVHFMEKTHICKDGTISKILITKPWSVYMRINGKRPCLGFYSTKEDAMQAYKNKFIELYGEI